MKPKIVSLLAEIGVSGWQLLIIPHYDSRYGDGYDIIVTHGDQAHALKVVGGDDEQLRAALQSLLHEIRILG